MNFTLFLFLVRTVSSPFSLMWTFPVPVPWCELYRVHFLDVNYSRFLFPGVNCTQALFPVVNSCQPLFRGLDCTQFFFLVSTVHNPVIVPYLNLWTIPITCSLVWTVHRPYSLVWQVASPSSLVWNVPSPCSLVWTVLIQALSPCLIHWCEQYPVPVPLCELQYTKAHSMCGLYPITVRWCELYLSPITVPAANCTTQSTSL
jgi:hypothetical protein